MGGGLGLLIRVRGCDWVALSGSYGLGGAICAEVGLTGSCDTLEAHWTYLAIAGEHGIYAWRGQGLRCMITSSL